MSKLLVYVLEFSISATTSEPLYVFIQCCWSHACKKLQKALLTTFQCPGAQRAHVRHLKRLSSFRESEHWYRGVSGWNPPRKNFEDHRSFWKTWLFCIFSLILPICSTDIPLKWVPSYCRSSVQISSCLWLRRRTCLKESNGLTGLFFFFFFLKNNYFFI